MTSINIPRYQALQTDRFDEAVEYLKQGFKIPSFNEGMAHVQAWLRTGKKHYRELQDISRQLDTLGASLRKTCAKLHDPISEPLLHLGHYGNEVTGRKSLNT